MLRVPTSGQGSATPDCFLVTLQAAAVGQCRQQLSFKAALPSRPSRWRPLQGRRQPAVAMPPSYVDGPAAAAVAQQTVALASALLPELLPLPASGAGGASAFEKQ